MDGAQDWQTVADLLRQIAGNLLGSLYMMSPIAIGATVAVAFFLWLHRRPGEPFLAWLMPARIYRTAGFGVDLRVWLVNLALGAVMAGTAAAMSAASAAAVLRLTGEGAAGGRWHPLALAALYFLVADFMGYAWHRVHHEVRALWPIHALHHSAEELHPIAAFRHHPVYRLGEIALYAVVLGAMQVLVGRFLSGSADVATLAGTNVFFAAWMLAAANLRHSHIWLRFPRPLEYVFVSPAMHQIHHSIDPRHQDRNYGEVLAIWDLLGGSLHIPRDEEAAGLRFGLADGAGGRMPQPHGSLRAALVEPLRGALRALRRR